MTTRVGRSKNKIKNIKGKVLNINYSTFIFNKGGINDLIKRKVIIARKIMNNLINTLLMKFHKQSIKVVDTKEP